MLDWIAGYVARWTGLVEVHSIDLVHWALHALAGVVYTVFGHVGKAWAALTGALDWLRDQAKAFADQMYTLAVYVIRVAIPALFRQALFWYHAALDYARTVWRVLLAEITRVLAVARAIVQALRVYVDTYVLAPLTALIRQLRADLLKWGYTAWWLITHPSKLAPLLIDAIVAAAVAAFDRVAVPAGEFALRLVARQPRRWLTLIERIVAAVL